MKKTLFLITAITSVASVNAQSSITLAGTVDTAVNHVSGSLTNRSQLISGGNATSKIIIRGREDLGGGNHAGFWLESGLNADTGTGHASNSNNQPGGAGTAGEGLTFNRRSSVEIGGGWGALEAGRLWSPTYDAYTARYDVFGVGVGIGMNYIGSINPNQIRVSNGVGYITPTVLDGFYGKVQQWFGENVSGTIKSKDGTGNGIMLAYEKGPISARAHYARTRFSTGDAVYRAVAGHYNFSSWRISGNFNNDDQGALHQKGLNSPP